MVKLILITSYYWIVALDDDDIELWLVAQYSAATFMMLNDGGWCSSSSQLEKEPCCTSHIPTTGCQPCCHSRSHGYQPHVMLNHEPIFIIIALCSLSLTIKIFNIVKHHKFSPTCSPGAKVSLPKKTAPKLRTMRTGTKKPPEIHPTTTKNLHQDITYVHH